MLCLIAIIGQNQAVTTNSAKVIYHCYSLFYNSMPLFGADKQLNALVACNQQMANNGKYRTYKHTTVVGDLLWVDWMYIKY